MRIISGHKKGLKLKSPKGLEVRPTEDRIKESVFNMIGNIHHESKVLDLFAGSGAIGLEFISRGANICYFVDKSADSISIVKDNIKLSGFEKNALVIKKDAKVAILNFYKENLKFDFIYLDPPFRNEDLLFEVLDLIYKNNILSKDGIMIIEHEKELILGPELFRLIKYKNRNYGSKTIDFYKHI